MKFFHFILLFVMLLCAEPGFAQEKPVYGPINMSPELPPAKFGPSVPDSLAVVSKDGEAWALRCAQDKDGNPVQCEIFQRLVDSKTGQRLAEFAIGFPEGKDTARGVAILPLGILLDPGGTIQIDDGQRYSFKLRFCAAEGCYAYVDLTSNILFAMKAGKQMMFHFTLRDGEGADLTLPLAGFTDAFDKV